MISRGDKPGWPFAKNFKELVSCWEDKQKNQKSIDIAFLTQQRKGPKSTTSFHPAMDSSSEEKISLKLAEISIQKFNQTIPQYLNLLKNHKCNIEKAFQLKDWDRIKREQINATRVIKQMKFLILEIDKVRSRVRNEELDRFDEGTDGAKKTALAGMGEYLGEC